MGSKIAERCDFEEEGPPENFDEQNTDECTTDDLPESADSIKSDEMPEAVA